MKPILLALAVLLTQVQTQTGVVTGQLRSPDGRLASGIRVAALALPDPTTGAGEGALVSLTQTDSSGRYRLEAIPPGRYYILAGLIDFPSYYPGVNSLTGATSIVVAADSEVKNLDFTMTRGTGVKVSGRFPSSQRPTLVSMSSSGPTFSSNIAQVKSDGSFEFLRVTPGSYTLSATPANGLPTLPLTVGDKDIDVGLPNTPGVKISGVVGLGRMSPKPANEKVLLTGAFPWASIEAPVNSDGRFEFPSVPPGAYTVKTIPGGATPVATIAVADRQVAGIVLSGFVELKGKAALEDGKALPKLPTALMIEAKRPDGTTLATAIRQDGVFRFPLAEGTYSVRFRKLPPGFSVKSISYDSTDLLKDALVLDGASEAHEIRVTLAKAP